MNTPLFTDYALKLRTIFVPANAAVSYQENTSYDFPTGTVISKTFFYPRVALDTNNPPQWSGDISSLNLDDYQLIETRLLIKQTEQWDAIVYVWRDQDAYLTVTGTVKMLPLKAAASVDSFPYVVPTRNECAGCHATDHTSGAIEPIGLKTRHLNRAYGNGKHNQLNTWPWLKDLPALTELPKNAEFAEHTELSGLAKPEINHLARSYLDINCGHCHNPVGAADTSGLMLDYGNYGPRQLGVCKPPIAAGKGTGGHKFSVVPQNPDASILVHRMETSKLAERMPEIGRSLPHQAGVQLVRHWITDISGECQ